MNETDRLLLVLDESGALSDAFLDRLGGVGSVLVSRSVDDARDRIESGRCRAVVIAAAEGAYAPISLAFYACELSPGLLVMILGSRFEPQLIQMAVRSGLHLIVDDGDEESLANSVLPLLDPAHLPA